MSCNISQGRLEGCKDQLGGLTAVYFVNYGDLGALTSTDESITAIGATTPNVYKYDLRGTSTFEQSLTSSRENGTTFAEQTLTVSLKKQDASTSKEIKLLAYGRPQIIIEDNNGSRFLMGEEYGSEMSATSSTGAAMGDKTGYELTFAATEKGFAKFVNLSDFDTELSIQLGS